MKVLVMHSGLLDVERQHIIAELAKLGYETDFERSRTDTTVMHYDEHRDIATLAQKIKDGDAMNVVLRETCDMIKVSMHKDEGKSWLESIREASLRKSRRRKR
jgi:hypothetical protein